MIKNRPAPVIFGCLTIPEGTEEIPDSAYAGVKSLINVKIPGTVKRIGWKAFADCTYLNRVTIGEGVTGIDSLAFMGCKNLKAIKLPASMTDISGNAFFESGLKRPVLNATQDKLIYCLREAAGSIYTVPEGIREIGALAFDSLPELKKVILPKGLEVIRSLAFSDCGIQEIVLPNSIKLVEFKAFFNCKQVVIKKKKEMDLIEERLDSLRMKGRPLLRPQKFQLPEEKYWETPEFHALAAECSLGKIEAMQEMADFFEEKEKQYPQELYYSAALRFWTYRAYEWGSRKARKFLDVWFRKYEEGTSMTSPYLGQDLHGCGDGAALRALGFFFFEEGRFYDLQGRDSDGVVEVSSWVDMDGPDEDGYGREEYYDYWYVDDCLNLPLEGKCLPHYSKIDKRMKCVQERFRREHEIAAMEVRRRYAVHNYIDLPRDQNMEG